MTDKFQKTNCLTLHLGAHKTATTHLQNLLAHHQNELLAASIFAPPLAKIRPILLRYHHESQPTYWLWHPRRCAQDLSQKLAKMMPDAPRHILISEENLIGKPIVWRTPYRQIERTLEIARHFCAHHNIPRLRVAFCIRQYDDFLLSALSQRARSGRLPTQMIKKALTNFTRAELGWPSLLQRICKAAPQGTEFIFWHYEHYRSNWQNIADRLAFSDQMGTKTGIDWRALKDPPHTKRLSEQAVAYLLRNKRAPLRERTKISNQAAKRYPISADNPAYAPFNAVELEAIRLAYLRDHAKMHRQFGEDFLKFADGREQVSTSPRV